MSKVKLDRVLFEYMESITEKEYNYSEFLHELSRMAYYFLCEEPNGKELSLLPFFKGSEKEKTIEKLFKAYMLGYEEESDKYTIVLFEEDGFKSVLWEVDGGYEISEEHDYVEMEGYKKSFTKAEILNKFPKLWPLAQKNK